MEAQGSGAEFLMFGYKLTTYFVTLETGLMLSMVTKATGSIPSSELLYPFHFGVFQP